MGIVVFDDEAARRMELSDASGPHSAPRVVASAVSALTRPFASTSCTNMSLPELPTSYLSTPVPTVTMMGSAHVSFERSRMSSTFSIPASAKSSISLSFGSRLCGSAEMPRLSRSSVVLSSVRPLSRSPPWRSNSEASSSMSASAGS